MSPTIHKSKNIDLYAKHVTTLLQCDWLKIMYSHKWLQLSKFQWGLPEVVNEPKLVGGFFPSKKKQQNLNVTEIFVVRKGI